MKKTYKTPMISMSFETYELDILTPSRGVGGGPTQTGTGPDLPVTVGETDGSTNPFLDDEGNGTGQGSGGDGNRAPERWGDLW